MMTKCVHCIVVWGISIVITNTEKLYIKWVTGMYWLSAMLQPSVGGVEKITVTCRETE